MNYCLEAGKLHAYLDGELSEIERRRVALHLEDCRDCTDRLENMRLLTLRVDGLLAVLSETPVAECQPGGSRPHWRAWFGIAASLAAMTIIAVTPMRNWAHNLARPAPVIAVPKLSPSNEYFIPLDDSDEPIETGEIARINLPASIFDPSEPAGSGKTVAAEIILGVDGEPKAIRFLQ